MCKIIQEGYFMSKFSKIAWNDNGWTEVQSVNEAKHIVGISCYAENGIVKQVRLRHNDGEEELIDKSVAPGKTLPMPMQDFKTLMSELF